MENDWADVDYMLRRARREDQAASASQCVEARRIHKRLARLYRAKVMALCRDATTTGRSSDSRYATHLIDASAFGQRPSDVSPQHFSWARSAGPGVDQHD